MHPITLEDIINIWEQGQAKPGWQRALVIITKGWPELSQEDAAELSVGQRNTRIFAMRQALIGPVIRAVTRCPKCNESLEFEQDIAELLDGYVPPDPAQRRFEFENYNIDYRLLNSADLAKCAEEENVEFGRNRLAHLAMIAAEKDGKTIALETVEAKALKALGEQMDEDDPLAHIPITLACIDCEHVWTSPFGIVSFFWAELEERARFGLEDVVTIATHYGWNERDILAMSPVRRDYYLDAIQS